MHSWKHVASLRNTNIHRTQSRKSLEAHGNSRFDWENFKLETQLAYLQTPVGIILLLVGLMNPILWWSLVVHVSQFPLSSLSQHSELNATFSRAWSYGSYIYIFIYLWVVQKVHVRGFNCQGRQGSNMRSRAFFFSEFAKVISVGKTCSKKSLTWDPAKDKRGFRERFANVFLGQRMAVCR
jgi:hypothetical protein